MGDQLAVEQRVLTPLEQHVAQLAGGPWHLRREVAHLIGVTPGAVAAAIVRHPELARSRMGVKWHGKVVRLYSGSDIEALRGYFNRPGRGAGRPRIWTAAEAGERRRTRDLIRHHTERAERLARTDPERAHQASTKARELQQGLDAQLDRRMASRVAT